MTCEALMELVGAGEGAHVEYVRDFRETNVDSIGPAIAAFLNGGGGYVFAGVIKRADGIAVVGELDLGYEPKRLEKVLRERITPASPFFFEQVESNGIVFDVIVVPQGKTPPYAYNGIIYTHEGDRNARASVEVIRELVLKSEQGEERWENRFATPGISECIDSGEVSAARGDCIKAGRKELMSDGGIESVLEAFALVRFGRLLNAGVIMFASRPGNWMPQAKMRLIAFNGGKTDDFRDSRILNGPLCVIITRAMDFIKANTHTPGHFNRRDGSRSIGLEYPPMAVREALVNACAHRDYASAYGGVSVMLYSDRLEIWNSGSLPEGVTVEGLNALKGQKSVLRNPTVADVLYIRGFMEQTGRGSVLIPEECRRHGLPCPVWDVSEGVKITFTLPISASGTNNGSNGSLKADIDSVFRVICDNPGISRKALISAIGRPVRSVQRAVDSLIAQKKIESRGRTKGQGYYPM